MQNVRERSSKRTFEVFFSWKASTLPRIVQSLRSSTEGY